MGRFVVGVDRDQVTLFPPCLEDWIAEDNPVRVIDVFVDYPDLSSPGFEGVEAAATGRPGYHPSTLPKLYVYGYLNRIPSSRRLERAARRNIEVMWLTARLSPNHKTIAEFRRQKGSSIGGASARFVSLCREMGLLTGTRVAIDSSKFKAVNKRDHNFAKIKIERRCGQVDEGVSRHRAQLDTADRQEPTPELAAKVVRLKDRIARLGQEMERLAGLRSQRPHSSLGYLAPGGLRQNHRRNRFRRSANGRLPTYAGCSTCPPRHNRDGRGSNPRWMKVRWQVKA